MNYRKFLFLLNGSCMSGPYAGAKAFLEERLPGSVAVKTSSPHDTFECVKNMGSSFDGFVAFGGDGTANTAINAMLSAGYKDKIFGVMPAGSGNDFATAGLKIKPYAKNYSNLLPFDLSRSFDACITEIDIGYFRPKGEDDRYFLNILGQGFDGKVVIDSPKWKNIWKDMRYPLATMENIFSYSSKFSSAMEEFKINGRPVTLSEKVLMLALMNSPAAGNGLKMNPYGSISDSSLDLLALFDVGGFEFLKLFLGIAAGSKKHIYNPNTLYLCNRELANDAALDEKLGAMPQFDGISKVESIYVKSELSLPVEIDGELAGHFDEFEAGLVKDFRIKAIRGFE